VDGNDREEEEGEEEFFHNMYLVNFLFCNLYCQFRLVNANYLVVTIPLQNSQLFFCCMLSIRL
jgi:hypothetical protein